MNGMMKLYEPEEAREALAWLNGELKEGKTALREARNAGEPIQLQFSNGAIEGYFWDVYLPATRRYSVRLWESRYPQGMAAIVQAWRSARALNQIAKTPADQPGATPKKAEPYESPAFLEDAGQFMEWVATQPEREQRIAALDRLVEALDLEEDEE